MISHFRHITRFYVTEAHTHDGSLYRRLNGAAHPKHDILDYENMSSLKSSLKSSMMHDPEA